jgi:hypothetical protein
MRPPAQSAPYSGTQEGLRRFGRRYGGISAVLNQPGEIFDVCSVRGEGRDEAHQQAPACHLRVAEKHVGAAARFGRQIPLVSPERGRDK